MMKILNSYLKNDQLICKHSLRLAGLTKPLFYKVCFPASRLQTEKEGYFSLIARMSSK